ncbi:MAG: methylated-DNA--[protein]-cysteine S-methyltransferase [Planctomycetaceae bacterium]
MRTHTIMASPVGDLTLVNTDGVLSGISMGTAARPAVDHGPAGFERVIQELGEYFAGQRTTFTVATAARGRDFDRRVWALLAEIPFGQTRSYGDLARALGDVGLSREVGGALGRNPIGIVVPCHRVLGADGSLTGYAGGLERKRFLLDLERGVAPLWAGSAAGASG